jgi:hypothetical protein
MPDAEIEAVIKQHLADIQAAQAARGSPASRMVRQFGGRANEALATMVPGMGPENLPDILRAPPPETFGERMAGSIGEELGYSALPGGGMLGLTNRLYQNVSRAGRQLGGTAREIAERPARFAGMETGAAVTAGAGGQYSEELGGPRLAGQMTGAIAPTLATASARFAAGNWTQLPETMAGYTRIGVEPSLGLATRSRVLLGTENFLSLLPTSSGGIRRAAIRMQRQFQQTSERLVANLTRSPQGAIATAERAGRIIDTGLREGFLGRFRAVRDGLYATSDNLIRTDRYSIQNTATTLGELLERIPDAPALNELFQNPRIRDVAGAVAEDAVDGRLSYAAIRGIRTEIGTLIADPDLLADVPRAELRRLYASLSEDMTNAARQNGPDALRAMQRATRFNRAAMDRMDDTLRHVWTKVEGQGFTPETIYQAAISQAAEGPTLLRALRKSLTVDEWRVVSGTVLRRLGRETPAGQDMLGTVFSTEAFLNNWNGISAEARRELFNRPGWETYTQDIDQLARSAEGIRAARDVFVQKTDEATKQAALYTVGGAGAAVLSGNVTAIQITAGLASLTAGSAYLLTSPRFVHWLARAQRLPVERLPGHIARLGKEDFNDPAVASAVSEFLGFFEGVSGKVSPAQQEAEQKAP